MNTIDFHTHLLNKDVKFNRIYDKLAIQFFGKKFGLKKKEILENPYQGYYNSLINNIKTSEHVKKIVLFGVDSRIGENDEMLHNDITVCASNEDLNELYQKNKDVIIPFFSINPNRSNAIELIDFYVEQGFKGGKFLQNYWNVNTNDKKYIPYFEKLVEKDLPLIIHIGSESSVHSFKKCESIEMLQQPLEIGVKVVCAHMALSYEPKHIFKALSKNPKNFNQEYYQLLEMLKKYDNLYADISALLTPVRAKVLPHLSKEKQIHHKLLFGTDFPVPFDILFNTYDLSFKKRLEINKIQNPFDRYSKSILEYFPKENPIYSNYQKLIKF